MQEKPWPTRAYGKSVWGPDCTPIELGCRLFGFRLWSSESPPWTAWSWCSITTAVYSTASNKDIHLTKYSAEFWDWSGQFSVLKGCDYRWILEQSIVTAGWEALDGRSSEELVQQILQESAAFLSNWPRSGKQDRPYSSTMQSWNCFVVSKYKPVWHLQLQSGITAGSNYCSNHIKVITSKIWIPTHYYWSMESFFPCKTIILYLMLEVLHPTQTHYLEE